MEGSSSPMEDENEDLPWTYKEILEMMCKAEAETKKNNFPKYWSSIQKHYASCAPPKAKLNLSPYDLHRKWTVASASYEDKELSSIVMKVAPSIVSVSVFAGVRRYLDCSGFISDWDSFTKKATILTSAKVLRFPGKHAIRLANGKILLGEEDYVDHHNNIVTLKADSDATLKPLKPVESTSYPVETIGRVVVALGRDFYTCKLLESSGVIRTDHPYFGCEQLVSSTCSGSEVLEGGPLITRMGHGCGINFFDGSKFVHPLPTSVIYSCLNNRKTSCMRPWFGLSVIDISQLPHDALENIAGVYGDSTVVVRKVYVGSPADKVKVYPGETVTALKRGRKKITIDSASEYVRTLSNISEELSACCPNKPPEILISVCGYDSDSCKVVHAENLAVNDKKFCCSWVVDESDEPEWDLEPRFGSQMAFTHEIDAMHENGINTDVILEPTWSETGTAYDNEMSEAVFLH